MKTKIKIWLLCLMTLVLTVGCGQDTPQAESYEYSIYYVNKDNTKVVQDTYVTDTKPGETQTLLEEFLDVMQTIPDKVEYTAPLAGDFKMVGYTLKENLLNLDFDENYTSQTTVQEILNRAAIVRTLIQIEGIENITFSVNGEALADTQGLPIGTMTAESFIDNAGTEINAYEKAKLHLYFANEAGDALVEVDRQVVYNSNISMEKLVVEELIKGPNNGETWPTINPDTKVLGVTVKDGVCYINFSDTFLTQIYNVTSDVTIYSITNSLAELPNVNKVQISINGETNVTYREKINLTTMFDRNLDVVQ